MTIDNSAQAENLPNFPVQFKLDSSRIDYAHTQNAGQDLRFVDADGSTVLAHEIEKWNEAGESWVWVKVPQIDASSSTDYVWMYYGNPSVADGQSVAAVWSGNNYKSVWHLKEDPSGAAPQIMDSTSSGLHGTSGGSMTSGDQVTAKVDGGLDFDGTDDVLDHGDVFNDIVVPFTVEAWVYHRGSASNQAILSSDSGAPVYTGFWFFLEGGTNELAVSYGDGAGVGSNYRRSMHSIPTVSTTTWTHVAAVVRGETDMSLYIDGAEVSGSYSGAGGSMAHSSDPAQMGNFGTLYFNGILDEVRLSTVARSAAWIAAAQKTQSDTFASYSAEETSAPSAPQSPFAEGQTNPTRVTDLTPELSAIYDDPETADSAPYYEIEVNTASGFSGTVLWDTGKTALSPPLAENSRMPDVSYAGTALSLNSATYYWRIRFWDSSDSQGAWSATQTFSMAGETFTYRSIGTNAGTLYSTGTASISLGTIVVTFGGGASLPSNVGQGDKLTVGTEVFYIKTRDGATQVTVQEKAGAGHSAEAYSILRAYNTLTAWESARQGNLVAENRIEVGVAYNDGAFNERLDIDGSTTDASHYLRVTVAAGQRHNGTAGSGARINYATQGSDVGIVTVYDAYTVVEWLEITGAGASPSQEQAGVQLDAGADQTTMRYLLVHDIPNNGTIAGDGVVMQYAFDGTSATVYNSIIYDIGRRGVQSNSGAAPTPVFKAYNVTVYNNGAQGIAARRSDIEAKNVISMSTTVDFAENIDGLGGSIINTANNLSSDATADDFGGTGHLISKTASNQFTNLTPGSEDLHLKAGTDALDTGTNLSGTFSDDIDGVTRSAPWDIGADEMPNQAPSAPQTPYAEGQTNPTGVTDLTPEFSAIYDDPNVSDLATSYEIEVWAPWWNESWTRRRKLTINNSAQAENLQSFPILVKLDATRVDYAQTQGAGQDLRFVDANGTTVLAHEIESWDEAGTSWVWVNVPQIDASSSTDTIWMYYGNTGAADGQNKTGTWDGNYKGVWHLHGDLLDSTSSGNNATNYGSTNATGKIADGQDFDGASGYVNAGDTSSLRITGAMTVEAWVRPDAAQSSQMLTKAGVNGDLSWEFALNSDGTIVFRATPTGWGSGWESSGNGGSVTAAAWNHVVGRYTPSSEMSVYVNGSLGAQTLSAPASIMVEAIPVVFGAQGDQTAFFDGQIDEVRISNVARSAAWIAAQHKSMGDTYLTYAGEEASSSATLWDTGQTVLSPNLSEGVRMPDVSYAGTALSLNGATYNWHIRFWDNSGATGAWSAWQQFTMGANVAPSAPQTPYAEGQTNPGDVTDLTPEFSAIFDDPDTTDLAASYEIEVTSGVAFTGNGADGSVTISTAKNINSDILGSLRSGNADGITTAVSSFGSATGGTTLTVASATGFAANDEALLINLQGSSSNNGNVGNYEFLTIQSIASNTLTFTSAIQKLYGASTSNLDLTGQKVVVQRVPRWTTVTINSPGSLTASDWNGTSGGVLVFRATGAVTINSGGSLHVNGKGYLGGDGPNSGSDVDGYAGESYRGAGAQGPSNNGGGGGGGDLSGNGDSCGEGGAGGAYGAAGSRGNNQGYGTSCYPGIDPNPPFNTPGTTYGVAALTNIYLGSGGGGGGNDSNSAGASGDGGDGAGLIMIYADTISVSGTMEAIGSNGIQAPDLNDNGNGGGGSGGSILLTANSVTMSANSTRAVAGSGAAASGIWNGAGGNGGTGRIRIEANSISGTTSPSASTAGAPGGTSMWDTGKTTLTPSVAENTRMPDVSYAGTALAFNAAIYTWRIRFWDSADAVGTWSADQQFTMHLNQAPSAPQTPHAEGQVTPATSVSDPTPELSAIYDDPDTADSALYYEIEVNTASNFLGTVMWDTNKTALGSALAENSRMPDVSYAGTPLALDGATYYWRLRFWDVSDAQSAWSATQQFTLTNPLKAVYYSVGTSSADLKSGTPTVGISNGTATFSAAQPNNVGVGDEITYSGTLKAYITGRTSSTVYSVVTARGATPADVAGATVNSIKRAFNLLSTAEANSSAASYLNTADLVTGNYQLNWPAYDDAAMDDTVIVDGYTTGANNYVRVFTPTAASEVGASQRHTGVAGTGFRLRPTVSSDIITVRDGHVRIEGLEFDGSLAPSSNAGGIWLDTQAAAGVEHYVQKNIIHDTNSYTGIYVDSVLAKVADNILYDVGNTQYGSLTMNQASGTAYFYNNTVYGSGGDGIAQNAGTLIARNNVAMSSGGAYADYAGTITQNNNVSSDATASGAGSQTNKTAYATYFVSVTPGSENLHLLNNSNALWGSYGADLDSDPNLPVTDDMDGEARSASQPDIGADEAPNQSPSAPQTPYAEGLASPVSGVTDLTPELSAIYDDSDTSDTALYYEIEVRSAAWWDPDWARRRKLTFENAGQSTNLIDFPVLVKLDATRIDYAQTQDAGQDLRFVDGSGATLAYEIEEWNESGTSYVWVNIPQIDALSSADLIWMYYGNPTASAGQSATSVWDSSFKTIWHLNQTSGNYLDSTTNNHTATLTDADSDSARNAAGIAGKAIDFGGEDYISSPDHAHWDFAATPATVEWWFKTPGDVNDYLIMHAWSNGWECRLDPGVRCYHAGSDPGWPPTSPGLSDNQWHYAALSFDGSTARIYVDGVLSGQDPYSGLLDTSATPLIVGSNGGTGYFWDGLIDEVRISHAERSDDWIAAQYDSQVDRFIAYSGEESYATTASVVWDTGKTALGAPLAENSRMPDVSYAGTPLSWNGAIYAWRIRFWDSTDLAGAWSAAQIFTMHQNQAPSAPQTPYAEGQASPVADVTDSAPEYSAIYDDPETSDTAEFYEIEVASAEPWWDTAWTRRRKLTIDNADRASNLIDFPLLVQLDSTRVDYAQTQNAGQDLRFIDANGATVLAHEIERWNESGASVVWVKVPQIDASSSSDFIWMYYGNPSAPDAQDAEQVWSANYKGVWHLKEDQGGTGALDLYRDSTTSHTHGDDLVSSTGKDGRIGLGQTFDGTDDMVNVGSRSVLDMGTGDFSISAWVKYTAANNILLLAQNDSCRSNAGPSYCIFQDNAGLLIHVENASATSLWTTATTGINDNNWHQVFAIVDRSGSSISLSFYVDGSLRQTATNGSFGAVAMKADEELAIGSHPVSGTNLNPWAGSIDEVRIAGVARSADWVVAQYDSQRDVLLSYAGEETNTAPVPWDSGKSAVSSITENTRSPDITHAGTPLTINGSAYFWRIRFWDNHDAQGVWSAAQRFSMHGAPASPQSPLLEGQASPVSNVTDFTPEFSAVFDDPITSHTAEYYEIEVTTAEPWWDTSWARRRKLTIDNSAQSETLLSFPLSVKLNASRIDYGQTQNAGQDLRFLDADGVTVLAHEIEEWNEAGTSYVWVNVPQIDGSSNTDYVWVYYGNPSASDGQDREDVWDANLKGVWHLREDQAGTGSPQLYRDSTANHNHGMDRISASDKTGKVSGGQGFDGVDDWVDVGRRNSLSMGAGDFSLNVWAKWNHTSVDCIIGQNDSCRQGYGNYALYVDGVNLYFMVTAPSGQGAYTNISGFNDNAWHHLYGVADRSGSSLTVSLYVDGVLRGTSTNASFGAQSLTVDEAFGIGGLSQNGTNTGPFAGSLDEARVSNMARSAAWVAAEYKSQNDTFLTYGAEQSNAGTVMWDTGKTSLGISLPENTRMSDVSYAGTPLSTSSTYYWRLRFWDNFDLPSSWSATQQFTMGSNAAPSAPQTPYAEGQASPVSGVTDLTPEFSAIYDDPNTSDTALYYEIEVNTASNFLGTVMWDTDKTALGSALAENSRMPDVSYAGTALSSAGVTYYWRIRFWDNSDATGAWSATQQFSTFALGQVSPAAVTFPPTTLNGTTQMISGSTAAWRVDTNYDPGTSWHVTIASGNFISGPNTIPVANFLVRLLDATIVVISGTGPPSSSITSYTPLSSSPQTLLGYSGAQGQGVFDFTPDFRLSIPSSTYAGSYSAIVSVTFVLGP